MYSIVSRHLKCDKCYGHLIHPEDHAMISYRGQWVDEDNLRHLEEVAIEYGWKVEKSKHICNECRN